MQLNGGGWGNNDRMDEKGRANSRVRGGSEFIIWNGMRRPQKFTDISHCIWTAGTGNGMNGRKAGGQGGQSRGGEGRRKKTLAGFGGWLGENGSQRVWASWTMALLLTEQETLKGRAGLLIAWDLCVCWGGVMKTEMSFMFRHVNMIEPPFVNIPHKPEAWKMSQV